MCIGGGPSTGESKPEAISIQSINTADIVFSSNGFSNAKNTVTKCGDMRDKPSIALADGVGFDCNDLGCTYACENGNVPNVLRVKCLIKGAKKKLVPKRAKIHC